MRSYETCTICDSWARSCHEQCHKEHAVWQVLGADGDNEEGDARLGCVDRVEVGEGKREGREEHERREEVTCEELFRVSRVPIRNDKSYGDTSS